MGWYYYQFPTWIAFPSMGAFHFPANTVLFFPLTKTRAINLTLNFYSLIPSWPPAFCLLWDLTQLILLTCPVLAKYIEEGTWATVVQHSQQSLGQEASQGSLGILVSGSSSPLSPPCQCGEDPFSNFKVFIQEDLFKTKVLAQDQSKVITKDP